MTARPTLQKTMEVMQALDDLRLEEKAQAEAEQWVDEIQKAYEAQGIEVDRSLIQKAIAEKTAQTYTLHEPTVFQSWVGRVLVHQARIGKATLGLAASLALFAGVSHTWSVMQQRNYERVVAEVAELNDWAQKTDASWEARDQKEAKMIRPAVDLLLEDLKRVSSAKPLDSQGGKKVLAYGEQVKNRVQGFDRGLLDLEPFEPWLSKQTWNESWVKDRVASLSNDRNYLIQKGEVDAALEVQHQVRNLTLADQALTESRAWVASWPAGAQKKGQELLAVEEASWKALKFDQGQKHHEWLKAQNVWLKTDMTLRVVNSPTEKSGVWRTMPNTSIKNYYLVVQAVNALGQPIPAPVVNEETQKNAVADLFAVRVSEEQYEKIKQDKIEDGIVDNVVLGQKKSGSFDIQYAMDVSGGMITEW